MTIVFDGKSFAAQKEQSLRVKIQSLKAKGIVPGLVSIVVGDNPASLLYTRLKKKAAERVGIEFETVGFGSNISVEKITDLISRNNVNPHVQGIMVQMPLPNNLKKYSEMIVDAILPERDVDGLRKGSPFVHATSRAVIEIIGEAERCLRISSGAESLKVVVVGATGMVGRPLVRELGRLGFGVTGCDINTPNLGKETIKGDILVSATGKAGLITADMIKGGAIVIDVGSPKGDVEPSVSAKASFITPVPGGVGPVTISCLLENLVEACYNML
jgi:methylenetetrahydrofolate dehydrogenase (NADP+)/methenyltetrahydrofolate cyclohydrolase